MPFGGFARDLQRVRTHEDDVSGLDVVDVRGAVVHPAVEQVHVAEELVDEGVAGWS